MRTRISGGAQRSAFPVRSVSTPNEDNRRGCRCGNSEVQQRNATLREANLAESSHDKVVMWTGGSSDCEDVAPALVRLDRPEVRSARRCRLYFVDPEADVSTNAPGPEDWTQPRDHQPGETRVRKRHRRCDAPNLCCICTSWIRLQRYHSIN